MCWEILKGISERGRKEEERRGRKRIERGERKGRRKEGWKEGRR